ncbi:MAG: phosphoribosylformylglycinamidine synthase subunit PurL [Candidatus Omnitrophota bacterium]|nr:MAG: phosphoribosylformylglycinamidine synthase subunit PurL [Candidatus Omnitrophota bacterium]
MEKEITNLEIAQKIGISPQEYKQITELLKREPNYTELGLFSAMWSEHCSYKNSKKLLRLLPKEGDKVFVGAGENSGAVFLTPGYAIVFKIESHNHPSAVAPYEASATGGGGCIRDIFTMGARPLFLLSSLRFGSLTDERTKFLFKEVGRGFTDYANAVGLPALAGEVYFDESYQGNPLVNAMVVGILKKDNLVKARAEGIGNEVIIVGGPTGRDGVEGASFASSGLDESSQAKTGAVAIGDPQIGKRLIEACLEVIEKKLIVGMQDMGAAGLVCSTSETAYKAGTGIEIDISLVPRKEEGMTPYEVMLSESQERMLLIVKPENTEEVKSILKKWDIDSSVIGKVTADGILRVKEYSNVVAQVPVRFLAEGPEYKRETKKPEYLEKERIVDFKGLKEPQGYNEVLIKLLSSTTIASKEWIAKKVDPKLIKNSCLPFGSDAGVYYVPQLNKAIAATVDGNGLYCYLDPLTGGKIAVAEAARNLVCCGAEPRGVTDGLNFGSPYNPQVYWQFENVIHGIAAAAKFFDVPVVSGNVSFNNENPKGAIFPTPIIGMVGVIDDLKTATSCGFKKENDLIFLIGENKEELGASQYLSIIHNLKKGSPPQLDLEQERNVQLSVLTMIKAGLVSSAHDCSEGGFAVALAESCISGNLGAQIKVSHDNISNAAFLFGETQSRIIISVSEGNKEKIEQVCAKFNVKHTLIGKVRADNLKINELINVRVADLTDAYKQAIPKIVEG